MAKRLAKRFYGSVTVESLGDGWAVFLDGMQLRTPGKLKLALPTKPLADRVAAEWDAQIDRIDPSVMPVTRLVNVAAEQTPPRRQDLVDEAVRYAQTDLVCYRADQPRILKERQAAAWDKWRDWAAGQGVDLNVAFSVAAIPQPEASCLAVRTYAQSLDDLPLTLFVHLIAVYGSVVLALAVMKHALSPAEGFDLSRVDYTYQRELWGDDEEQAEIDAALREETIILGRLLTHFEGQP